MPTVLEDHIPLDYTIDINDTHGIIDPHGDCIEAQSIPSATTKGSSLSRYFSSIRRSLIGSEADTKASSSQKDHPNWPTYLREHYKHMSHKKPARELVDSTIRCLNIGPDSTNDCLEVSYLGTLGVSTDFKTFIDKAMMNALQQKAGKNLQICIFTPSSHISPQYFSFVWKLLQSFRIRVNEVYEAPSKVLAHCIADFWEMDDLREILVGHSPNSSRYISTRIPSQRDLEIDAIDLPWRRRANFVLEWQRDALKYTNDLSIYVWQPHLQRRPKGYRAVSVMILAQQSIPGVDDQRRMILKLDSPEVKEDSPNTVPELIIHQFLQTYQQAIPPLKSEHPWTATHEIFRTLLSLFQWMVHDTAKFVDSVMCELREMTVKGRMLPSRSKVQYLVHLEDCRRRAIEDLSHSLGLLDKLSKTITGSDFCCQETVDKTKVSANLLQAQDDIRFLRIRLHKLERPIKSIREQVLEQMNLAQGERTVILTIAAALFIPLSFVSGIFGMNVKQPLFPSPPPPKSIPITLTSTHTSTRIDDSGTEAVETDVHLDITTSWSTRLTATTSSTTPGVTLSPGDSKDPHLFDMSRYLEIALPMTIAVIIVPLIIGPLLRFSVQTAFHYSSYWRILCVVAALSYFAIVYGLLWPPLDLDILFSGGGADYYWNWSDWYDCEDQAECEARAMKAWAYALAYVISVLGTLGSISLYKLLYAYKEKRGRWAWTWFSLVVYFCLYYEFQFTWKMAGTKLGVPLSWVPFAILLFAWAWSERSHWLKPYRFCAERRAQRVEARTTYLANL